ncbi:hypothetical protein H2203_007724 [Taxawa tesnikishii (nom. ined.)]|nr:hypothetical protein H2203_007724 [Dothideales sp. JES 119]
MARTRARSRAEASGQEQPEEPQPPPSKKAKTDNDTTKTKGLTSKRKAPSKATSRSSKSAKKNTDANTKSPVETKSEAPTSDSKSNDKVQKLISAYGVFPLSDTALKDAKSPTAETVLAHVFNAMLTSARISHNLAIKSVHLLLEAGYADLSKLEASSWEERTEVLTKGGYTHYRERTATQLGDLAKFVREKYDGHLNNLLKEAKDDVKEVRNRLKEVKGLGNVGLDIFCDTAQGIWPSLAPFLDPRNAKVADAVGIGSDVNGLWEAVGKEPMEMCKLAAALTTVRLEKKEKEFA